MPKGKKRKFDKPDPARKLARKRKNVARSLGMLGKANDSGHRGRIVNRVGVNNATDERARLLKDWERTQKVQKVVA